MISFHQGSPVLTGCCSHLCWTTVIIFNCQGYSQKIKAVLMLFQCLLIFYLFANSVLVSPFKTKKKRNDRNKRKKLLRPVPQLPVTCSSPDCCLLLMKIDVLTGPKVIWLQEWSDS